MGILARDVSTGRCPSLLLGRPLIRYRLTGSRAILLQSIGERNHWVAGNELEKKIPLMQTNRGAVEDKKQLWFFRS